LTINNSTVFDNTASASSDSSNAYGEGGGIYIYNNATISNSTISGNTVSATASGEAGKQGAGICLSGGDATVTVQNSIIAQNTDNATLYDYYYVLGTLTDSGYNIVEYQSGNSTGSGKTFTATTDILYNTKANGTPYSHWNQDNSNIDGSLGLSSTLALNNSTNGTFTLALAEGSFAAASTTTGIPYGDSPFWNGSPASDQRGVARTAGQNTSIGAYSYTPPSKVALTGPATVTAGAVSTVFTLTGQDGSGNTANVISDTVFNLTSNTAGTATFYSDADGTSVITQTTITNGTSAATFYYKDTNAGTPTLTAAWNSGGTDLGSDTLPVTVSLASTTLTTSSSVESTFRDFKVTVTKIRMGNSGASWVTIFSGTAELDLVNVGTFPGISNISLPTGTYNQIEVTFKNSLPVEGTLTYSETDYYTTTAAFGGASNVASDPSNDPGSQTVFTFRISDWGALDADVVKEFDITPITVDYTTDYQPTLRFTISNKFLLTGTAGTFSTYYFELSPPTVSIVEP